MRLWLKGILLALAAFGLCWAGAVGYWQATNRMPSISDLLVWLLAVPLALLAAIQFGRRLSARRSAAAAAPAVTVTAGVPAAPAAGPALAILATAVHTPHGRSPHELAAALAAGPLRAGLDPELLDDEGYPVMSARVPGAGDPLLHDEFAQWLQTQTQPDPQFSDEHWRALDMGTAVVAELAQVAAGHPHAHPAEDGAQTPAPLLRLVLLAGTAWNATQTAAAAAWLAQVAASAGWPREHIAIGAASAGSAAAASTLAALNLEAGPLLAIVLAFDSAIGTDSVERMAADGSLFGAARPQGSIPGEGAAGLLLADPATTQLMQADAPLLHALHATREGSADAARRLDAATLRTLADAVLARGALAAPAVAMVFADADHRTSRVMELMALAGGLPHLDAGLDVKTTGSACGSCGAVPFMAALALAAHHTQELGAATLCVGLDDPLHRGAVLVRPAAAHT